MQGLPGGRWQGFVTVAGMVSVITAVLVGCAAGLLAAVSSGKSLVAALAVGVAVGIAALAGLMRFQRAAWEQAASLFPGEDTGQQ